MKKLNSLFLAALMCLLGMNVWALTQKDGVYQLGVAQDLVDFATLVSNGTTSANAVLTADIDMSAVENWVGIGTSTNQYAGTFDGQGHAITGFKQTTTTSYEGLFGFIEAATIKRFSISGQRDVTLSGAGGGSVIGKATGACTIEDIFSSINVTVTGSTYDHTGGIIGGAYKDAEGNGMTMRRCSWDGTLDIKPTNTGANASVGGIMGYSNGGFVIEDCVVAGTIKTEGINYGRFGGLVGWMSAGNTIKDVNSCIIGLTFEPATGKAQYVGGLFGSAAQGVANVKNCLWIMDYATAVASNTGSNAVSVENVEKISKSQISSGYATWRMYQLNGETAIRQTMDVDSLPVPDKTHGIVYKTGALRCDGVDDPETTFFSNTDTGLTTPAHMWHDGLCDVCRSVDQEWMQPVDSVFMIGTSSQLVWFAAYVNAGNRTAEARLTADIDMEADSARYTPIGYPDGYGGTFDGQDHRIRNLKLVRTTNDVGFIGVALTGMTFKNTIFDSSCVIKGANYVGAVGSTKNGATGDVYIDRIGFEGEVYATGVNAGGILGCNRSSASIPHLSNCYVTGVVEGAKESAALCGWLGNKAGCSVRRCWSKASVIGYESPDKYLYRWASNAGTASDNYSNEGTQGGLYDDGDLMSGRLTWLLNGASFLDASWFQNVGEDFLPVLDATHGLVYGKQDTYGVVNDEASLAEFVEYEMALELAFCEEVVACQDTINAYASRVEAWSSAKTLEGFLTTYRADMEQKEAIRKSEAAYAEYASLCENYIEELAKNTAQNKHRDFFEAYLDKGKVAEPGLYPNGSYGYILEVHTLTNEQLAEEMAYVTSLMNLVLLYEPEAGTEMTNLLTNANFADGWTGWEREADGGLAIGGNKEIMTIARGQNYPFEVKQRLDGIPNGIYELRMNGMSRASGDVNSRFYSGMLFLNDNINYVMSSPEGMLPEEEAMDSVNCLLTGSDADTYYLDENTGVAGWLPTNMVGCSYAFNAGRYLNRVVAEVKDSTLTIGVRDKGAEGGNWLPFANARLFYLGTADEAGDMLTPVLEGYVARANTIRDFAFDEGMDFAKAPNISEELKEQLVMAIDEVDASDSGQQRIALADKFSKLFDAVYTCRMAYVKLAAAALRLEDVSTQMFDNGIIDTTTYNGLLDMVLEGWACYSNGSVSAEEALALVEELDNATPAPHRNDNGDYVLADSRDLLTFAMLVNGGDAKANAVMANDLDMSNMTSNFSIGEKAGVLYGGTFDGKGHKISNLNLSWPGVENSGLFNLGDGAVLKDFFLDETCTIEGGKTVSLVGWCNSASGARLEKVGNAGKIIGGENASGLMGRGWAASGSELTFVDCWTVGDIENSSATTANFIGWLSGSKASFTNCWSIASMKTSPATSTYLVRGGTPSFTNCYSLKGTQAQKNITLAEVTSGALCYLLNGDQSDIVWYQNLGEGGDPYPVTDRTHKKVFKAADGTYYNEADGIVSPTAGRRPQDVIYDLSGRRVEKPTKGVYIVNGKKVLK